MADHGCASPTPISRTASPRFLRDQARGLAGCRRRGARDHRPGARRGRRGADRLYADASTAPTLTRSGIAVSAEDIDRGLRRPPTPRRSTALQVRARPHPRASRAADARATTAIPTRWASSSARAGRPIEAVGLYVPGGTASYPSSVLMNAVPAKVAGVERIVMVGAGAGRRRSTRWCWSRPSSPA